MGDQERVLGGCIKKTRGPWTVKRATKNRGMVTKFRFPSDKERLNNKQRERKRRAITRNIFAGLRAHGNYQLPKNPDSNDLLRALCEEAGWHVEEDGIIYRKEKAVKVGTDQVFLDDKSSDEDYCTCDGKNMAFQDFGQKGSCVFDGLHARTGHETDLTLSIPFQK